MNLKVSLSTDAEGFLSQECPVCGKRFKVMFGEGSDRAIGHCPYCGHAGKDCWWTKEQAAYLTGVVGERMVNPMLEDFARGVNRMNRGHALVQMKARVKRSPPARPPVEPNRPMPVATFPCCNERIKHDGSTAQVHCIICGKVTDLRQLPAGANA